MTDPARTDATAPREPLVLQVLEKLSALMTAAFGFVAALAWNDAIKAMIQTYVPTGTALRAQILYAIVVTAIAVLAGLWIASATSRVERRLRRERRESGGAPPGAPHA